MKKLINFVSMDASNPLFLNCRNHNNVIIRHGRSKALISLTKILHTIYSFPPSLHSLEASDSRKNGERDVFCEDRGFEIDLNIRLGPPPEIEDFEEEPPSVKAAENDGEVCNDDSVVVEKIDSPAVREEKCSEECGEVSEIVEEREFVQSTEIDSNGVSKIEKHGDFNGEEGLSLLIAAAELISGGFKDYDSDPDKQSRKQKLPENQNEDETAVTTEPSSAKGLKRSQFWTEAEFYGDFEDLSPVVRSKRGRNQVLPYKYRDSFVEPLKPTTSRHRSAAVSSKRRSRGCKGYPLHSVGEFSAHSIVAIKLMVSKN